MLLRALGKVDLPLIMKVEKICFPDEKWREEDYLNEIEHNPFAHYYGLLNDDDIIGVIGIWFTYETSTVTTLGILPEYRGHGYGEVLLDHALKKAHEYGCLSCDLEVRVTNEAAIHLYRKRGFVSKALRKNYYENNHEDAYLMIKEGGSLWQ